MCYLEPFQYRNMIWTFSVSGVFILFFTAHSAHCLRHCQLTHALSCPRWPEDHWVCTGCPTTCLSTFLSHQRGRFCPHCGSLSSRILHGWVVSVSTSLFFLPLLKHECCLLFCPLTPSLNILLHLATSVGCLSSTSALLGTNMDKTELLSLLVKPFPSLQHHCRQKHTDSFCSQSFCVSAQPAVMPGTYDMTMIPFWLCSQNTLTSVTHHPSVTMHHVFTLSKFCHLTHFQL